MCLLTLIKFTIICIKPSYLAIFQAASEKFASDEFYLMPVLPCYYWFYIRKILNLIICMSTNRNALVKFFTFHVVMLLLKFQTLKKRWVRVDTIVSTLSIPTSYFISFLCSSTKASIIITHKKLEYLQVGKCRAISVDLFKQQGRNLISALCACYC